MKTAGKFILRALCGWFFAPALLCCAACGGLVTQGRADYEVLVSDREQVVFTVVRAEGILSVYDALADLQTEGKLTFEGQTGDYGFFIAAVNGVPNAADWSASWMIYTDLIEYDGVVYASEEFGSFSYGGKTYASAAVGASDLPALEGYIYALHYDLFPAA